MRTMVIYLTEKHATHTASRPLSKLATQSTIWERISKYTFTKNSLLVWTLQDSAGWCGIDVDSPSC